MNIVCPNEDLPPISIDSFLKSNNKYYAQVFNEENNLYVQSCIMEKTHLDENDILLRFKNSKNNRGCEEFYKLINQVETDICNIYKDSELNTPKHPYIYIKKHLFRSSILPSRILGEDPMLVAKFPLTEEVEIYDKKGNSMSMDKLKKCNEVVVILKCSNVEVCDNNLRLNWEVQQIAGIKRKKKIKVDKTFKIRKDN